MNKRLVLPSALLILLFSNGCYVNKAMVNPYGYAPSTHDEYWVPPKQVVKTQVPIPLKTHIPAQDLPLTLAEALDVALINNTATQQTWADARQAASTYGQSQSTALPEITAEFDFIRTRLSSFVPASSATTTITTPTGGTSPTASTGSTSPSVFIEVFGQWGPQLHLAYTVFDFGKQRATSEAARQALYYADYTHNREIQTVIQTITTDYYSALYQRQLLEAYLANVETANMTLDEASIGLKSGVKDISDVMQATTHLLQNEIQLVEQKQQVTNSYAQLMSDMGIPATLEFALEKMPDTNPKLEEIATVDDFIQIALSNRPDYLASIAQLKSKQDDLKVARREVYPVVNYNFDYGRTYYNGGLNDGHDFTSFFSVKMPIFRAYYYRNNMKKAEAEIELAEANLKQLELDVIQQISTAHYNIKVAFDTLRYAKQYLASAEEQYTISLAQYRAGTNTILDVISAQSSLADARARLANAVQGWYTSLANLTYAVGIIVQPTSSSEVKTP